MSELRLFISSTFRDLRDEREYLVRKIFPEIRIICRERGVMFTEIDLRWGLTDEQAAHGTVIRTCLEEVDRCRPFFIGLIGARYGWVPEYHELMMDPDLTRRYPWIEEVGMLRPSVTELEFYHGLFNTSSNDVAHSLFYRRESDGEAFEDAARLDSLAAHVLAAGRPLRPFRRPDELGDLVRSDLLAFINEHWPVDQAPTPLQLDRRAHAAFAASRKRAYIPNVDNYTRFQTWLDESRVPLVIHGSSGFGKSALAAWLMARHQSLHPNDVVIEHYVGATDSGGVSLTIIQSLILELRERFEIDRPVPPEPNELERTFQSWLSTAADLARRRGMKILILIDGMNQLSGRGAVLEWLPRHLPEGMALVLSTTPGEILRLLQERGYEELVVGPIGSESVRQSIVVRYLGEFHKGIPADLLARIVRDPKAQSPLFLRVISEELRLHGEHETLRELIDRYLECDDLHELFQRLLERVEHDFGDTHVGGMLSAIHVSRIGLSETELLAITRMSRVNLSRILFALDDHLVRQQGLLGFHHDYLRRAVWNRYLSHSDQMITTRKNVAALFEISRQDLRSARELLWQYFSSHDWKALREHLSDIPVLTRLYIGESRYEVLGAWKSMIDAGVDVATTFRDAIDRLDHAAPDVADLIPMLYATSEIVLVLGSWDLSTSLMKRVVESSIVTGDILHAARAEVSLGWILEKRGESDEAMQRLEHGKGLYERLGDRRGVASAVAHMGIIHRNHGRTEEALHCQNFHLAICEAIGNRSGIASALGHLGILHKNRGDFDRAMECYCRQIDICRNLGDKQNVGVAIGNKAVVHKLRGEYQKALQCNYEALALSEEIGDRNGVATTLVNIGHIQAELGEFDKAMEYYQRHVELNRDLGDSLSASIVIGSIGKIHEHRGEYDKAMECYQQKLAIRSRLDDPGGIATSLMSIAGLYLTMGKNSKALDYYQRVEVLHREIGNRREAAAAVGNIGRTYADMGRHDAALRSFAAAIDEHRAIGYKQGLMYWLLGSAESLERVVDLESTMPPWLHDCLPDINEVVWKQDALSRARAFAEECISIADALPKPEIAFAGRMLTGWIRHELRKMGVTSGDADEPHEIVRQMLDAGGAEDRRAELSYWLWKMEGDEEMRRHAIDLFRAEQRRSPKREYIVRLNELESSQGRIHGSEGIEP